MFTFQAFINTGLVVLLFGYLVCYMQTLPSIDRLCFEPVSHLLVFLFGFGLGFVYLPLFLSTETARFILPDSFCDTVFEPNYEADVFQGAKIWGVFLLKASSLPQYWLLILMITTVGMVAWCKSPHRTF